MPSCCRGEREKLGDETALIKRTFMFSNYVGELETRTAEKLASTEKESVVSRYARPVVAFWLPLSPFLGQPSRHVRSDCGWGGGAGQDSD
jgi:hypothetical protein